MRIDVQMSPASDVEQPVQVWLVDDNNQLRELIARSLERDGAIRCLREFDCPNGLLSALASRTGPDVILLDIQMGELNGLDALPAIKSLAPETRVFMLTTFFDPSWHKQAMDCGASGYYLKGDSLEKLVASIRDRKAEQFPVRRRRRQPCASTRAGSQQLPALENGVAINGSRKPGLLRWFKRFASNQEPRSLISWVLSPGRCGRQGG
jgi:DNA-binding NarL/FixJ family response regulator